MSAVPAQAPAGAVPRQCAKRASTKLQGLQVFMENRLAVFGVVLLALLVLFSFAGPLLWRTDQIHTDLMNSVLPPSAEHPLGTDKVGYDQLGRLMEGGKTSIIVGIFAGTFATAIGTAYGAIAGFVGGWVDAIMMRIVDSMMSIPVLFLFMLIATMVPPTVPVLIAIMAALSWLGTSRLIRGEALSLRTREYVMAMRGMGGSGTGMESMSAFVYGCFGFATTSSAGPSSTILPRYMTPIRSAMYCTTARSWLMNR